ncbi:MAG TPA: hypothetical protein VM324_04875 [Egibacteraceae bacterium]|jgi:negative regulator of sigma E activity|nr:hypothetical protein [Egibacteraceae bacterium]
MSKKDAAKKVGIFIAVKKLLGKVTKLAVVAGVGAAVIKVLRGEKASAV